MRSTQKDLKKSFIDHSQDQAQTGGWLAKDKMRNGAHFTAGLAKEKSQTCMGIWVHSDTLRRYKLILRSGASFSFSYALLPIIQLESEQSLKIIMSGVSINVQGRGLHIIEGHLAKERLEWIKEHPSLIDDGLEDVYIKQIYVHGDQL